jgi:hypothetical protein
MATVSPIVIKRERPGKKQKLSKKNDHQLKKQAWSSLSAAWTLEMSKGQFGLVLHESHDRQWQRQLCNRPFNKINPEFQTFPSTNQIADIFFSFLTPQPTFHKTTKH